MRGGLARETGRWAGSGGAHGGLASGEALWGTGRSATFAAPLKPERRSPLGGGKTGAWMQTERLGVN